MKNIWGNTAAIAIICFAPIPALADGCDAIVAAEIKGMGLPTHSVTTIEMPGATPIIVERVDVAGVEYTHLADGSWRTAKAAARSETSIRDAWADQTCTQGGSEAIGSETALVFQSHKEKPVPTDTRIWISTVSGLLLKLELITAGQGTDATDVFDYNNIQAPIAAP